MTLVLEIGFGILVAAFILTLAIKSLFLQDEVAQANGPVPPFGAPGGLGAAATGGGRSGRAVLGALSSVPKDVYSILGFVILAVAILFVVWFLLSLAYARVSTFAAGAAAAVPPGQVTAAKAEESILSRLAIERPKFSQLPKDYSVNHPPWCLACQHRMATPRAPIAAGKPRRNDCWTD